MLTWAWVYLLAKTDRKSQLGHIVPMLCDVAIFYFIASALGNRP